MSFFLLGDDVLMKQKLILLLMLSFFWGLLFDVSAKEKKTKFIIDEVTAEAGEEVKLDLKMEDSPGFVMLQVRISYDKDKLSLISQKMNGLSDAMLRGSSLDKDDYIVMYALTPNKDKMLQASGTILTMTFKVKEDTIDEADIQVSVESYAQDESTPLEFDVQNGKIKIENSAFSIEKEEIHLEDQLPEGVASSDVKWFSSDEYVATVDENGVVHFKKDGNVTITAEADKEVVLKKEYTEKKLEEKSAIDKIEQQDKKNYFWLLIGGLLFAILIVVFVFIKRKKSR